MSFDETPVRTLVPFRVHTSQPKRRLKLHLDAAIHAFAKSMRHNARCRTAFLQLVSAVRSNSVLLAPAHLHGPRAIQRVRHVLRVCANVANARSRWLREPHHWQCDEGSTTKQMRSLILHMLADHDEVPSFLFQYWLEEPCPSLGEGQRVFLHMARGHSILGTRYGTALTRSMGKRFCAAPAHYSLNDALRFAQTEPKVRPSSRFPAETSRRRRKAYISRPLGSRDVSWPSSDTDGYCLTETVVNRTVQHRTWVIRELTSREQLVKEGKRMQHCVGSYVNQCLKRNCEIWTLESRDVMRIRGLVTIEVELPAKEIITVLGFKNREPRDQEKRLIRQWADREGLKYQGWILS